MFEASENRNTESRHRSKLHRRRHRPSPPRPPRSTSLPARPRPPAPCRPSAWPAPSGASARPAPVAVTGPAPGRAGPAPGPARKRSPVPALVKRVGLKIPAAPAEADRNARIHLTASRRTGCLGARSGSLNLRLWKAYSAPKLIHYAQPIRPHAFTQHWPNFTSPLRKIYELRGYPETWLAPGTQLRA